MKETLGTWASSNCRNSSSERGPPTSKSLELPASCLSVEAAGLNRNATRASCSCGASPV
eukprot:CAMPEP_0171247820 /NCGR_PEP_ID=MMETSP0790-20130122/48694_1 /TAXON_ID=2925 /ORGANISM="Alexandrium catenella, Strain OF101" /LENGTH=58 /DNA_ID=CAMNT_0011715245 /DNA_START=63 /DNA_END=235 /DNA_ORIENTATION=-